MIKVTDIAKKKALELKEEKVAWPQEDGSPHYDDSAVEIKDLVQGRVSRIEREKGFRVIQGGTPSQAPLPGGARRSIIDASFVTGLGAGGWRRGDWEVHECFRRFSSCSFTCAEWENGLRAVTCPFDQS